MSIDQSETSRWQDRVITQCSSIAACSRALGARRPVLWILWGHWCKVCRCLSVPMATARWADRLENTARTCDSLHMLRYPANRSVTQEMSVKLIRWDCANICANRRHKQKNVNLPHRYMQLLCTHAKVTVVQFTDASQMHFIFKCACTASSRDC